ncbi:MAG TPA: hypothetical protein VFB41_08970 [Solirubrobacteraceae bacterium]|nr:hypothetical protein [Solirubrobacteraceae bacterium]
MAVWEIVLLILVVLVALLFAGGYVANARLSAARQRHLRERVAEADHALAAARASDRGWDRSLLEQAARAALTARRPGASIEQIELIQVVDLPGTDSDSAVFHVTTSSGEEQLEMIRRGDEWAAA